MKSRQRSRALITVIALVAIAWMSGSALVSGAFAARLVRGGVVSGVPAARAAGGGAQSGPHDPLAREIFKELIEINTTDTPAGNVTRAAEAMAARLEAAGFPAGDVQVLGPDPRKGNLVARLRGSGAKRPILLLAHLDVVEARREDWSADPFTFLEKDGFFYGRGTSDDKGMAAQFVANLIRLKRAGITPARDVILALTADEEGGTFNGVEWLLQNHRALIDADPSTSPRRPSSRSRSHVPQ